MKKILIRALCLLLALSCLCLPSCKKKGTKNGEGTVRLTFADSIDLGRIEELAGKTVEIVGYMATVSPVSSSRTTEQGRSSTTSTLPACDICPVITLLSGGTVPSLPENTIRWRESRRT